MNQAKSFLLSLAAAGILLVACQPSNSSAPEQDAPATSERAESPQLGLALANVPEGFQVVEENELRLQRTDDQTGEVWIEVGPVVESINLVQEVRNWEKRFDEMPGGDFKGQMELGTQFGSAYSVRGRYLEGDLEVEQFRLMSLHPNEYRLLSLIYTYPAGEDSTMRSNQVMEVFGELEGLTPAPSATENAAE